MDKKEYNKIAEEVVKRYRENILPRIQKLEAERITSRKTANRSLLPATGAASANVRPTDQTPA